MGLRSAWRLLILAGFVVGLALVAFGIWEILRGCVGSGLFLLGLAVLPGWLGSGSRQLTGLASVALLGFSALAFTMYGSC